MTIEKAIQTAIKFENEVRDVYKAAAQQAADPVGKRVFSVMADEEQGHVDYLQSRLEEWNKTGKIDPVALETAIPSREVITQAADDVSASVSNVDHAAELKLLGRALEAERKTSSFYRQMVDELPAEGQQLFQRFVEIEEGHLAIVQAEMDSVTGNGVWFDVLEVQL
ncbi:MAG: ferritin family protein [Phycisphaerales bacterium]|nr:MAG: ferritin family protein [Phycisphaerales bacterium]